MPSSGAPHRRATSFAEDIANSNSTSFHFLGGDKQPTWMRTTAPLTGQSSIDLVQPIPHPSATLHSNSDASHHSSENPVTRLSIVAQSPDADHGANDLRRATTNALSSVLPSPAPSDEGSVELMNKDGHSRQPTGSTTIGHQRTRKRARQSIDDRPTHPNSGLGIPRMSTSVTSIASDIPNSLSPVSCLAFIDNYVKLHGGQQALSQAGLILPRVKLLSEASVTPEQDLLYLVLHQILCLYQSRAGGVPPTFRSLNGFEVTMNILHILLGTVEPCYGFLEYFSHFPYTSLEELGAQSPAYATALGQAANCILLLSQRFASVEMACIQQHRPPRLGEMNRFLGVSSPIIQRLICNSSVRKTFNMPQQYHELLVEMDHAFRKYQAENLDLLIRVSNSALLVTQTEGLDAKYEAIFAEIYRQLREWKRIATLQPTGSHRIMLQPIRNGPSIHSTSRPRSHAIGYQDHGQAPAPPDMISVRPQQAQLQLSVLGQDMRRPGTFQIGSASTVDPNALAAQPYQQGMPGRIPSSTPRTHIIPSSKTQFYARQGVVGAQITPSEPHRFGLHQAHLRSPTLRVAKPKAATTKLQPLYQFVSDLALAMDIDMALPVHAWEFTLTERDFSTAIPQDISPVNGRRSVANVDMTSRMFRLRCAKADTATPMSQWVVLETSWPTDLYFMINDIRLQPRKKLHHGKDLPIDITSHMKVGSNSIRIYSNRRNDVPSPKYTIAVEILKFKQHEDIKADCMKRIISAAETKCSLVKSLTSHHTRGTTGDCTDDDEVMILSNTLTISLLDPFLASCIWEVPVRGASCAHRECWDLETWLQTRRCGEVDVPSAVDNWKCPICKGDGRPESLVVDEWMMQVKDDLRKRNLLQTRAIIVAEDGSWTIKDEASRKGVTGGRKARELQACASAPPLPGTESPVVDLDGLDVQ